MVKQMRTDSLFLFIPLTFLFVNSSWKIFKIQNIHFYVSISHHITSYFYFKNSQNHKILFFKYFFLYKSQILWYFFFKLFFFDKIKIAKILTSPFDEFLFKQTKQSLPKDWLMMNRWLVFILKWKSNKNILYLQSIRRLI